VRNAPDVDHEWAIERQALLGAEARAIATLEAILG
jgi:hypothetical protein